jgi:hypothetical protein
MKPLDRTYAFSLYSRLARGQYVMDIGIVESLPVDDTLFCAPEFLKGGFAEVAVEER